MICPCCGAPVTAQDPEDLATARNISGAPRLLFDALARRAGRTVTYDTLVEILWPNVNSQPELYMQQVGITIWKLRQKLIGSTYRVDLVRGLGYVLKITKPAGK